MMSQIKTRRYTILAIGFAKWRGSDARALAQSFRKLGHILIEVDAEDYVSWRWNSIASRVLRRIFMSLLVNEYNRAVVMQAQASTFDFILVFKGMYLKESTMKILRLLGKPVYNFYPDVSYLDHGPFLPRTLCYYDIVFTTKTFHSKKERDAFRIKNMVFVRHGFDPEVHRPVQLSKNHIERYGCDVSFVGCWSPEKEQLISYIIKNRNNIKLHVYGIGWKYASQRFKKTLGKNLKNGSFGDELAIIYNASKINLGLLSCAAGDPSVSDKITARSFQIPASGSVMLHQDTAEVRSYFISDKEVVLFSGEEDLIAKIDSLLSNESFRESVRLGGYQRCTNDNYNYSASVDIILKKFEMKTL